nr:MAG TPA: hypothetical protein [Caudoviricetes sp.]
MRHNKIYLNWLIVVQNRRNKPRLFLYYAAISNF